MNDILSMRSLVARQQLEAEEQLAAVRIVDREIGTLQVQRIFEQGPGIVVLQGIRRCGKSVYSLSCFKGDYCYLNFDDERFGALAAKDLDLLLEACYQVKGPQVRNFILDEIQLVPHWESFVSRLGRTKNVMVTGSNAKLLSSELATRLTGRYLPLTLHPFSFREFLDLIQVIRPQDPWALSAAEAGTIHGALDLYAAGGGLPDARRYGSRYPQTVYSDIIDKDILIRHKIRDAVLFREFARFFVSNNAQEISLSKLGKLLGIASANTAATYARYLQETYLITPLTRYFDRLKAQIVSNKKYYPNDTGIISAVAYTPTENRGALYENMVFLELLRQRDYFHRCDEIFFWSNERCAVDFLLRRNKKACTAIQVCSDLTNPLTREREVRGLVEISQALNPPQLAIIANSAEEQFVVADKKIEVWPLWKWLLDPGRLMAE